MRKEKEKKQLAINSIAFYLLLVICERKSLSHRRCRELVALVDGALWRVFTISKF